MEKKTARESFESSNVEAWYDKVFVKHLVKNIQDVDPGIGAFIFPEVKQIVFYWNKIILHKVWLDEHNTENTSIEEHKKTVADRIRYIKLGLLPIHELQQSAQGFNKNKTGKII